MKTSLHILLGCTLLCLAGCGKKHTTTTTTIIKTEESSDHCHHNCTGCHNHNVDEEETELVVSHQNVRESGVIQASITNDMK